MQELQYQPLDKDHVQIDIEKHHAKHVIHNHENQIINIDGHPRNVQFDLIKAPNKYQITIDALINDEILSPALICQMKLKNQNQQPSMLNRGPNIGKPNHPSPVYVNKHQLYQALRLHLWNHDLTPLIKALPEHGNHTYYSDHYLDENFFTNVFDLAHLNKSHINGKRLKQLQKYSDRVYNHYAKSETKLPNDNDIFIYR